MGIESNNDGLGNGETVNEEVVEPGQGAGDAAGTPAEFASRRDAIAAAFEVEEAGAEEEGAPAGEAAATPPAGEKAPVVPPEGDKDTAGAKPPEVAADPVVANAPASWKPAQKEKWKDIPTDVRAEIIRRERETAQVVNDNQRAREFTHTMAQVIGPHAQRLQAMGAQPHVAVERLLRADLILSTSAPAARANFLAKMVKDYGVDINELDRALSEGAASDPANPLLDRVSAVLDQRLAPVNQFLQNQQVMQQAQANEETQRLVSEVDAMAANPEKYPYFQQVREDMADIVELSAKKGVYLTTEQAYNKAIGINPEVYAANQARIQADTARIAAAANTARARKAKSASLSIAGSASGKPTGSLPAPSDRRGTIAAALDALEGR